MEEEHPHENEPKPNEVDVPVQEQEEIESLEILEGYDGESNIEDVRRNPEEKINSNDNDDLDVVDDDNVLEESEDLDARAAAALNRISQMRSDDNSTRQYINDEVTDSLRVTPVATENISSSIRVKPKLGLKTVDDGKEQENVKESPTLGSAPLNRRESAVSYRRQSTVGSIDGKKEPTIDSGETSARRRSISPANSNNSDNPRSISERRASQVVRNASGLKDIDSLKDPLARRPESPKVGSQSSDLGLPANKTGTFKKRAISGTPKPNLASDSFSDKDGSAAPIVDPLANPSLLTGLGNYKNSIAERNKAIRHNILTPTSPYSDNQQDLLLPAYNQEPISPSGSTTKKGLRNKLLGSNNPNSLRSGESIDSKEPIRSDVESISPLRSQKDEETQTDLKIKVVTSTEDLTDAEGRRAMLQKKRTFGSAMSLHKQPKEFRSIHSLKAASMDNVIGAGKQKMRRKTEVDNIKANLGWFGLKMYRFRKWMEELQRRNIFEIPLMIHSVRFIEGRFGNSISSYFVLSRRIFFLNFILGLIWTAVILIPGLISQDYNQILDIDLDPVQFLTGKGGFAKSVFFFPNYPQRLLNTTFDFRYAFLSVQVVCFFLSFLTVVRDIKGQYMRQSDDLGNSRAFASAVLTTWDFSLSSEVARKHIRNTVATQLKALLGQAEIERLRNSLTTIQKIKRYLLRFIANILILVVYFISGLIVFFSVFYKDQPVFYLFGIAMPEEVKFIVKTYISEKTSIIIALLNVLVLNVFLYIGKMEYWDSPMTEVSLLVARSFFFKIASLYLIVVSTFIGVPEDAGTSYNWELELGQKFYALVWSDFLVTLATTLFANAFIVFVIYKGQLMEFDIAGSILELVYRQAFLWFGSFYSPAMPFFMMFTCYIIFHVKKLALIQFCQPPRRIYSSFQQNVFFLFFMLGTLILMMLPLGYSLLNQNTTAFRVFEGKRTCNAFTVPFGRNDSIYFNNGYGPFGCDKNDRIFSYVNNIIEGFPRTLRNAALFLQTPAFIISFVLIMGLWVYYLIALSSKSFKRVTRIREELDAEREEKRYLLKYYNKDK